MYLAFYGVFFLILFLHGCLTSCFDARFMLFWLLFIQFYFFIIHGFVVYVCTLRVYDLNSNRSVLSLMIFFICCLGLTWKMMTNILWKSISGSWFTVCPALQQCSLLLRCIFRPFISASVQAFHIAAARPPGRPCFILFELHSNEHYFTQVFSDNFLSFPWLMFSFSLPQLSLWGHYAKQMLSNNTEHSPAGK